MLSAKRYSYSLISIFAATFAILLPVSFWLEPLNGDLTRLGGYSENHYGWRTPQRALPQEIGQGATPNGQYDIVVLGDSFSEVGLLRTTDHVSQDDHFVGTHWVDYLASLSGLRVGFFPITRYTPEQVFAMPGFRAHPPKITIYERIERYLKTSMAYGPGNCRAAPAGFNKAPAAVRTVQTFQFVEIPRARSADPLNPQIGYAVDYLSHLLDPLVGGSVIDVPLTRADLFSNAYAKRMLIFREDLQKRSWTADDWKKIRCNLLELQHSAESHGTAFVVVVAPDRLTAYEPYIADPSIKHLSKLGDVLAPPLHAVRVDKSLAAMIAAGEKDVYLPNDTHWGWIGHRQVGVDVYSYLIEHGLVRAR